MKKRDYQGNDQKALKQVSDILYTDQEFEKEFYYLNKACNKIFINFLEIKSVYNIYHLSFLFKSAFHKHFKTGYAILPHISTISTFLVTLPSPILVFQSMARSNSSNSSFVFRNWNYATAAITLVLSKMPDSVNSVESYCLNMGCKATLVYCFWLIHQLLEQKMSKIASLLKIMSIESFHHNSDKYMIIPL